MSDIQTRFASYSINATGGTDTALHRDDRWWSPVLGRTL